MELFKLRTRLVRTVVAASAVGVLAALAPIGWPSAAGANLTFSYRDIAANPIGTNEAQSVVVNDKLYLFGGFDVTKTTFTPTNRAWSYTPSSNSWQWLAPMPVNGITHAGIATDGSRYIYYAGGNASAANATQQVYGSTDAIRYDIVANAFTRLPSLPSPRSAGGLAYVGGKLYYFGGNNLDRTADPGTMWMLDVAGGATSWVTKASLPNPRNHLGWGVINGRIYAVGGQYRDDSNLAQAELDRYDPATNSWTVLAPMPAARSHVMDSTFVLNGSLVVAGGWTKTSVSAAVTAFDPSTGAWSTWSKVPEARTSATAKSISGGRFLYCCGSAGTSSASGWMAVPTTGTPSPTPSPSPSPSPSPTPPPPPPPHEAPLVMTGVAVHPSTVTSAAAGKALVYFRLNHKARVTLVLRRCTSYGCTTVASRTVSSPAGRSHVSVYGITGRKSLAQAHYRVGVQPASAQAVTVKLVVKG